MGEKKPEVSNSIIEQFEKIDNKKALVAFTRDAVVDLMEEYANDILGERSKTNE